MGILYRIPLSYFPGENTVIKTNVVLLCLLASLLACSTNEAPTTQAKNEAEPAAKPSTTEYELVGAETDISFVIVSNSAGPITARFPNGTAGSLNSEGKGTFTVQLDTMKTLDQNDLDNPLRDANVIEAFFGVRPSAVLPEPVDKAWEALAGKLERSVAKARFEVTDTSGLIDLAAQSGGSGSLSGNLVLWNKISVPLTFKTQMNHHGEKITLSSSEAVTIDLEEVLGAELRKLAFDTMLAAGCAHQPGIQNQVAISLNKVTLALK